MDGVRRGGRGMVSVEPLEARLPMAGDVGLFVSGGNLRIVGDAAANDIAIVQTAAGEFSIVGNDGESFKLNDSPVTGPVTVTGVTKAITAVLGSGNDSVSFTGLDATTMAAKFAVFSGPGADAITVSSARFGGQFSIVAGNGDTNADGDTISIADVSVDGSLSVETGAGDDSVTIDGVTARRGGVNTAVGDDTVSIAATSAVAFDSLLLSLSFGADTVTIGTGTLSLSKRRSLFVGGPGDDTFAGRSNLAPESERIELGGFETVS